MVDLSAEEFCKIMVEYYPNIFNHYYKLCASLKTANYEDIPNEEKLYFLHEEINLSEALIYDTSDSFCNKVGKILIAETE